MIGEAGPLQVMLCAACSAAHLEVLNDRCPNCGSGDLSTTSLSDTGRVASVTTVRLAPPGVEVPYVLAYADFDPGARLIGKSPVAVAIGDLVRIEPVEDSVERFRFVPEGVNR